MQLPGGRRDADGIQLNDFDAEELWRDRELVLLRRTPRSGRERSLLTLSTVDPKPSLEALARLDHAFSLREHLDEAWSTRPRALLQHHGKTTLLMEDPGGLLLSSLAREALSVRERLQLALGLVVALGRLHERGIVHKDLKPAHLLAERASGRVWLTGFGIASRVPRERKGPLPPDLIAGTLAYMAPEQTGRMNRSVDSRADLYAVGVLLYELLTGSLPFEASEPFEWIHCHVARPPPRLVGEDILADIIAKLLAKMAQDRYQTAAGLEADLRRCLSALDVHGHMPSFPLGAHDVSPRLLIPEKLYGREPQVRALLAAFDRVVAHERAEVVLVSGYSGIGKSSVVSEIHKALLPGRALFATGKFDQYKRDIPYATIVQAFRGLIRQVLGHPEHEVARWRSALSTALAAHAQLIVQLIPELELIIGPQPALAELPPQEAKVRFQRTFRRFVEAFARPQHPLVLFLDDLQWLDAATLELFEALILAPEMCHLLLVGAYRDNEVERGHALLRSLDTIRRAGREVREIVLAPLEQADVQELVAESLRCASARAEPLTELVYDKAGGNPFFAIQFLSLLADEGLLAFDVASGQWSWDAARIRGKGFTDNVVDLVARKLGRLPAETQRALMQLACLGNAADSTLLEGDAALWEAVRAGLLVRNEARFGFVHDRVQEAAYSQLPAGERAQEHLRIGRILLAGVTADQLDEQVFEIVNQLGRGSALIREEDERQRFAELSLLAGKRAKAAAAYISALDYLIAGQALLPTSGQLAFELAFQRAECELLTGDVRSAERRLENLAAASLPDRAAVACLRIDLYTVLDRSDLGVEVGLDYLRGAGMEWRSHPTAEEVAREYEQLWAQLGERAIEELAELPLMEDITSRATMDVLTKLQVPALFHDERLHGLVIGRMANLSLRYGNSDGSCFAYCELGGFLRSYFGQHEQAARFARLSVQLVERPGLDRFLARVYCVFGYVVVPWNEHLRAAVPPLRRAQQAASAGGDLTFTAYSATHLVTIALGSGELLSDVQRDAELGREIARAAQFGLVADFFTGQLLLIRALRGAAEELDASLEPRLRDDPRLAIAACWYWIRKLQAAFFAGEYTSALEAAKQAEQLLWTSAACFEVAEYQLFAALAHAAAHEHATPEERVRHVAAMRALHAQIAACAVHCPPTFANRAQLVAAELARLEGDLLTAEAQYELAVQSARTQGFVHHEALAYELAARFYAERGLRSIARSFLHDARDGYLRWGALAKVQRLERAHPELYEQRPPISAMATIETSLGQLDLKDVVKVSQVLSEEIRFEELIERLLRIALDHAGATRGLLILPDDAGQHIEAEAVATQVGLSVTMGKRALAAELLPESVLRYVTRTQESVNLDDAVGSSQFASDPYIAHQRSRSVLCLPLLKQGALAGVLYLENPHSAHVFTPNRLIVLELLATQAGISLENARLYAGLQRSLGERDVLLREVHHRVKNNLQLISSLLNRQAHAIGDPALAELLADSRNRVRSMSLVHENLYRAGSFTRIAMHEHLSKLCAFLASAYRAGRMDVRVQVDVFALELDLGPAMATSLIVNELVSNALKHAFPAREHGLVQVALQLRAGLVIVTVRDDGVGLSAGLDPTHSESLGLQLVHDLTQQLHGTLELRTQAGSEFTITFPAHVRVN